jgi:chromosomal replication initiator protein
MYLLREDLKNSYPFIGRKLGGKDHTTAIHSYGKVSKELETSEALSDEISLIRQRIVSS